MESLLHGVSNAYASKVDRSAIGTLRGEHSVPASFLTVSFRRAASTARLVAPERRRGLAGTGVAAAAHVRTAHFPGGLNLFRRPQVGLRQLNSFLCAGNLALMPFC
jgi:hypothetical protein